MVQLKYCGDDRDYFKYDLISFVLKNGDFKQYGFVPMLTEHRHDNEGNIAPKSSACKSKDLLNFIATHSNRDLNNWELWLNNYISTYNSIQPINTDYFNGGNRIGYWEKYKKIISAEKSLVFFDPDTGIQAGRKSRIEPEHKEKYILNTEIGAIISKLSASSVFVIYQHLQRNSKKHEQDIKSKCDELAKIDSTLNISVYREKDLAFLFIARGVKIRGILNAYRQKSTVSPSDVYPKT